MNKRTGVAGGTQEQSVTSLFLIAHFTTLRLCGGQEGKETGCKEQPPKRKVGKKEE